MDDLFGFVASTLVECGGVLLGRTGIRSSSGFGQTRFSVAEICLG